MAFDNNNAWFTIGSSVTAVSAASQMFTGATQDLKIGGPRDGYNLTVRINSIYTAAVNTAATAATSLVSYTVAVDQGDTTDITSNSQLLQYPPLVVSYVIPSSSTISVTAGARATLRVQSQARYARVRLIVPTAPGPSTAAITTAMEAVLGMATPA